MKDCGPVPGECLSLILPLGNLNVSVVLLVVMSTPPAVNTPWAITVSLVAVAEVDMIWKCSMPEALLPLGAAAAGEGPGEAPAEVRDGAALADRSVEIQMTELESGRWLFLGALAV